MDSALFHAALPRTTTEVLPSLIKRNKAIQSKRVFLLWVTRGFACLQATSVRGVKPRGLVGSIFASSASLSLCR